MDAKVVYKDKSSTYENLFERKRSQLKPMFKICKF